MSEHKYRFRPTSPIAGDIWLVDTETKTADLVAEHVPNIAAAFIVRACNSHEQLVEVANLCLAARANTLKHDGAVPEWLLEICNKARAALAAAEGK